MSPDFHRHGLFHPRRSAVSQLAKAPSAVGRIRKEALQPAHRIRTGRPSALPKPHHCCGMFYYFFAALFSTTLPLFFRSPYLSRGEGQDGDRMRMWHISIPERRTRPLFFRYPLYRNSERNRSIRAATQTPQRSRAIALRQTSPAPPAIAIAIHASRTPCPSFCKSSCTKIFQRNKNIILFRSRAKNECRTPANAANLQHFRKFPCNLQLCPRPAHIARFNVRAREPN